MTRRRLWQPKMETQTKRRKIRKGTRSCWECKRRKIRCIFASSEHVVCTGCQRRRVPCVTQDMPEDSSPARTGNRHLGDRISRVEDFVKDFLTSRHDGGINQIGGESRQDRRSKSDSLELTQNSLLLTPDSQGAAQTIPNQPENETALHYLLKAFPSKEDTDILLRESAKPSLYTSVINTQPHSKQTREALAGPYPIAKIPSFNTHPVIVAKHMLMFSITLQTPSSESLFGLSEPHNVLMRRLTTAAKTWVTTKEEMHGTLEGLICIILEGIFEMNCGYLRRAWAVYRRAMTVAQLMGLHRSPMPPLKRLDPELNADPKFIWFRIIYMDRYLSLLLGLPQSTSDKSIGAMPILQHEPPMGKFERVLTVIASRILERNESAFAVGEIATTQSIDSDLLSVSKSMPESFWRPANFHNLTLGSPDSVLETARLAAQVYYYGLVIQLHSPYMMRLGGNAEYEYSKVACANASREIMTRFIAHRSFNPRSSCSRPVDFFALLAAMTLLLAHLDSHHRQEATNFLAHQRLGDRAMLEEALEKMDVVINLSKDIITEKSAELIRRLLDIEADAASGNNYIARSVRGDDEDDANGSEELRLRIPYLGIIKIGRQGPISREPSLRNVTSRSQTFETELPPRDQFSTSNDVSVFLPPTSFTDGQSSSRIGAATPGCTSPGDPREWGEMSVPLQTPGHEQSVPQILSPNDDNSTMPPYVEISSAAEDVSDWAFQGVDTAFFDSLMRGTSSLDAAGLDQ
ncbi:hypothetical protein F5Y00DRAFT_248261 [Daldinia vernicosa]|uniref:uncharacterized protein n=1 Tax=Daldinia vernicosa TaxID=114800 RepID=UPI002008A840|nr:uncharacterized protein F5Y00DRAFT_248261 [Daldinia vernicosa]KAI0844647.1 hypothetical protein F5Y00DRAFT_248261 [Daldinia vernicosa]